MIQGQLQFKHVALLLAMYQKLVHWLQVLTKARNDRLIFVWPHVHMVCCLLQMLAVYSLVTPINFFAFQFFQTELKLTISNY